MACIAPLGHREPDFFRLRLRVRELVGRLSRAAVLSRRHRMGCASSICGSDRHLWQAAYDNNEPELKRLIGLGWNVNWHNPEVRRRMRLAWAPASFRLYMLEGADTAPFFATAQRAASALAELPPRRHAGLCIRALDGPAGRADPPRAPAEVGLPHSMRRPRTPGDGQRSLRPRTTDTKAVSRSSLRPRRTSTTRM